MKGIDCNKLVGVQRAMCMGFDERGRPIPPEIRRTYLKRWGYSDGEIDLILAEHPSPVVKPNIPHTPERWQPELPDTIHQTQPLPGTELKNLLAKFGIHATSDCGCRDMAARMDALGPDWCRQNIEQILDVMHVEAKKRHIPFVRAVAKRIVLIAIAKAERKHRRSQPKLVNAGWFRVGAVAGIRFIKTEELIRNASALVQLLPPDVSIVVGVARSGVLPASLVAMLLHRPLYILDPKRRQIYNPGAGWRLETSTNPLPKKGSLVVIDDTTMTGNSVRAAREALTPYRKSGYTVIHASIYCNPAAGSKPDLFVTELPWPHLLEWNLFNSVLLPSIVTDMDGVLCQDCPPDKDDDGPAYMEWLKTVKPKYLVRRGRVPIIVTARLEKYRKETDEWLRRWGVSYGMLVMYDAPNKAQRSFDRVVQIKAETYRQFLHRPVNPPPHIFIESDDYQAQRIADLSGGLVVCPTTGKCYGRPT